MLYDHAESRFQAHIARGPEYLPRSCWISCGWLSGPLGRDVLLDVSEAFERLVLLCLVGVV